MFPKYCNYTSPELESVFLTPQIKWCSSLPISQFTLHLFPLWLVWSLVESASATIMQMSSTMALQKWPTDVTRRLFPLFYTLWLLCHEAERESQQTVKQMTVLSTDSGVRTHQN